MVLEVSGLKILEETLHSLEETFHGMPEFVPEACTGEMRGVLLEAATRMQDNYPYPHPLYAGQMLKPPHPVARLAYMMSMWINPNNHALDGGRASSAMEKEAVAGIATMFGWSEFLGHLCGGGTMANLEALWVSGRLHPGKKIVASSMAHYTHGRISEVLQLNFEAIPVDDQAKMDMNALKQVLDRGDVGTVVATLGTTGVGSVDPLPEIIELQKQYGFRIHVDSAYGGYFGLADNLTEEVRGAFDAISAVDSIVIDPHKHGLQPYGCGCVLFKDPSVGQMYSHDSPYTYFSSDELHLGEITLECSRAGASAVALWATQKLLPLRPGGQFAEDISKGRQAALMLFDEFKKDKRYLTVMAPELDIIIWAPEGKTSSQISQLSQACFDDAEREHLYLALMELPADLAKAYWGDTVTFDTPTVTCLRSTLMKPEHLEWLPEIHKIIDKVTPA